MQQFAEFVINHWMLVTAFCVVGGLFVATLTGSAGGGVTPQQAVQLINRENAVVIDVRSSDDFARGHVIDAINIPADQLGEAPKRLRRHAGKRVLVCCASGASSGAAVKRLREAGIEQVDAIKGGIQAWSQENLPLATG